MDDIKIFAKNEKEVESLIQILKIFIQDVVKEFGSEKYSILIMKKSLVLWYINHCRLFNAKSIFIHINSSISNNSV